MPLHFMHSPPVALERAVTTSQKIVVVTIGGWRSFRFRTGYALSRLFNPPTNDDEAGQKRQTLPLGPLTMRGTCAATLA